MLNIPWIITGNHRSS